MAGRGRPRRVNQNPRYAANPAPQNEIPHAPPTNELPHPGNPPPAAQPGLRQEDLMAIAAVVAQVLRGQAPAQPAYPAPPPAPAPGGTKVHYEALKRANVPTFDGNTDPEVVQKWLKEIEDNFELMEVPMEVRPRVVVPFLVGEAARWWEGISHTLMINEPLTWQRFREAFLQHFFPNAVRLQKMAEFDSVAQLPDMSVLEYSAKFHTLGKYAPAIMADPQLKMHRFAKGLKSRIQTALAVLDNKNFDELLGAAIRAEADIRRRDEENKLKRPRNSTGLDMPPGNRTQRGGMQPNKRAPPAQSTGQQSRKECPHCNRIHAGDCLWKSGACFRCGRIGHRASECTAPASEILKTGAPRANSSQPPREARVFAMTES